MKNMYRQKITATEMEGVVCHPDWAVLRVVPEPAAAPVQKPLPPGAGLIGLQSKRLDSVPTNQLEMGDINKREPVVFEVLAVGDNIIHCKKNDFVNITFLAGDKFGNSDIMLIHKDDITMVWGSGLYE